jgi:hypothetical protein
MIGNLNGKIRTRGRTHFYRTALSDSATLDVIVDDSHTKIQSINAEAAPLREVLKELKTQIGSFSYLIPGECGEKPVEWSFGGTTDTPAKEVSVALEELATLFGLKLRKLEGTYIFSGSCRDGQATSGRPSRPAGEFLQSRFSGHPHIYFPLTPLGE